MEASFVLRIIEIEVYVDRGSLVICLLSSEIL